VIRAKQRLSGDFRELGAIRYAPIFRNGAVRSVEGWHDKSPDYEQVKRRKETVREHARTTGAADFKCTLIYGGSDISRVRK
jgi:hypothetical protein